MNENILTQNGRFTQTFPVEYSGTKLDGTAIAVDLVPGMVLARCFKAQQNTRNNKYTRPETGTLDSHKVVVREVPTESKRGGIVYVSDFDVEGDVLVKGDFSTTAICIPVADEFHLAPAAVIDGTSLSIAEQRTLRSACGKFADTAADLSAAAVLKRVEFNGRR